MQMRGAVYVNGRIMPAHEAVVPVYDHGFVYGEGVYETLRTYNKVPFLFDRHVRRLRQSAGHIGLDVPFDDATLSGWIDDTVAAAARADGASSDEWYIRILLTRGVGELSYDVKATPAPSLVIIVKPNEEPPERMAREGIRISLVDILRNHPGSVNPIIKSNNLLNNALAMQRAIGAGGFEAVMRNHRGELAECSQSNLFVVANGRVKTPPLEAGLLAGITRQLVLELCRDEHVPAEETALHDGDLLEADEVFITSSTREIVPVVKVDHTTITDGRPGPITKTLIAAFRAKVERLCPAPV